MNRIGFIGYGEAAQNIIEGLQDYLDGIIAIYDKQLTFGNETLTGRITVVDSISELVQLSDIVIIAVPGTVDKDVFLQIIENRIVGKLFIDICTAPPNVKKEIDNAVIGNNGLYADVAVLGSLPKYKNKAPIAVSGSGADKFLHSCSKYCGNILNAGNIAGNAARIKLCRSVYMKGLAALLIETKMISQEYGIEQEVFSSIAESMNADSFEVYSDRIIKGTYTHCQRRKEELQECLNLFEGTEVTSDMTTASIKKYERILKDEK